MGNGPIAVNNVMHWLGISFSSSIYLLCRLIVGCGYCAAEPLFQPLLLMITFYFSSSTKKKLYMAQFTVTHILVLRLKTPVCQNKIDSTRSMWNAKRQPFQLVLLLLLLWMTDAVMTDGSVFKCKYLFFVLQNDMLRLRPSQVREGQSSRCIVMTKWCVPIVCILHATVCSMGRCRTC